ncbi:o-succinylbenzoate synthase [Mongoliibacter ruber]|uniref:O-succinylbenzoate synthase n=1 Tax=Mongoliibacter ruber TaxID=1750599 RepID=A0A2T0WVF7_9BACT|nr:o-succinylbenzoate synthase [Mongoliibacter ruber]PRY90675.1 o-succinylbenzoate synthase [Mongoliibacter ruber]
MPQDLNKISFSYYPHLLKFRFEAGTSRGTLTEKRTFFLKAYCSDLPDLVGWGEAAPLPNLSPDDIPDFEDLFSKLCIDLSGKNIPNNEKEIYQWVSQHIPYELPSVRFAFETALLDLKNGGEKKIFNTEFYNSREPISINGLIWMGDKDFMLRQIDEKLESGFDCIKMKIGAIDFDQECFLLGYIRKRYDAKTITLRVDANGAFTASEALQKMQKLASYDLHSIEQPIKQGQLAAMSELCAQTSLPIALDEELIGIYGRNEKIALLEKIKPQYIILKPTLLGGIASSKEWIDIASSMEIDWWMTSALESNIGLNAIAQFTSTFQTVLPQGLGTGQLYHNNVASPLVIESGALFYDPDKEEWGDLGKTS